MPEDKRQLVRDALNQRPVPRVPVGFWWHYYTIPAPIEFVQARMKGPSKVPPKAVWKLLPNNPFKGYESDLILRKNLEGHKRDYQSSVDRRQRNLVGRRSGEDPADRRQTSVDPTPSAPREATRRFL